MKQKLETKLIVISVLFGVSLLSYLEKQTHSRQKLILMLRSNWVEYLMVLCLVAAATLIVLKLHDLDEANRKRLEDTQDLAKVVSQIVLQTNQTV
jgi:hypothetical protein